MKISLLTVCYNSAGTVADSIKSVRSQDYKSIEYIIVDGNSTDGTKEVIKANGDLIDKWISEPDKGIYDAMNKAIKMATGEIVGILNSDDFYSAPNIITQVVAAFEDSTIDAVFGDLVFVDPDNLKKVVRKYSSAKWSPEKFARGFMPAHPTFFVRRKYYEQIGLFKTDYKIAADYELLIRFLYVHKLKYKYLPINMVTMRKGGVSSSGIMSNIILNDEIIRGCRENGIRTNVFKVYPKYFIKLFELFNS
ncbi:MAG TPA: glycosyltransferase family 2 protein [Cyclobacteriaceae bacterium]|jgi:glycosyltransferase involved in cell wall biosynthesis|nr:glycosyltransferase family 2 protein [Cyclobacteriaceae bacterium]